MSTIVIGIGEYAVTNKLDDVIKTLGLGSCVALIIRDMNSNAIGMAHIALPSASINQTLAQKKPAQFADTAIPLLLKKMRGITNKANNRGFIVTLVGGANVFQTNKTFNIGKRNALAVKRILWQQELGVMAEDVGGKVSRSVQIDAREGVIVITSPGKPNKIL